MEKIYDMIVVGGGPGGYTAALYAARAGMQVAVVEKLAAGGQMAQTHQVDNYPGFEDGIDGIDLADKMQDQAHRFGAETIYAQVEHLELEAVPKTVHTDQGDYFAKTVVIATGANPRKLGLPMEQEFTGRGVHYCAACDGMFYRGNTVVVVGGGNTAAADALALSRIAQKVYVVHRRDTLRATKLYHKPLLEAKNVEFLWNSAITALEGDGRLSGVVVKDLQNGQERFLEVNGLFVSIGRVPATALVEGQLQLDQAGYIQAGENTESSLPGVYAVGDVRSKQVRQIVTAVADGAVAAHAAESYLSQY
jgi:thioredoxin reductase (NADPH)